MIFTLSSGVINQTAMQNFEITFDFENRRYLADVSVIRGADHLQYNIAPQDEVLKMEYGNQVIHEFTGKPMQFAFPGSTEEKEAYSEALAAGLRRFLHQSK
jgi:hypothetical protein